MSTQPFKFLLLPGDGIGPEVMVQAERVIRCIGHAYKTEFEIVTELIGGASIDQRGVPFTDEVLAQAVEADAVLLGAVGGPRWEQLDYGSRPERGLLALRQTMQVFANIRPAFCFPALADSSSLKKDLIAGLDLVIVRELTGGVYFGQPRGVTDLGNGQRRGVNSHVYTTAEIHRVARVAFDVARKRTGRLVSVDKANVMEAGAMWREDVTALHAAEFADVELTHMYADNCAMQLIRNPKQFDVILTDNLFGDILSDEAAMLTGSIGMLPSASLGAAKPDGRLPALYEPVHGSAPDIAGRGIANPIAVILSLAMAMEHSAGNAAAAKAIFDAVETTLKGGMRTADIMQPGMARVSTAVMADSIISQMEKAAYGEA